MAENLREAKWVHVGVALVVLTLYLASFSWFLSWILPEGGTSVNAVFASRAWKVTLSVAVLYLVLYAIYFFVQGHRKKEAPKASSTISKNSIEWFDLVLILLPLTPVVKYIANNQDVLTPLGSLYVFVVFAAFSALFIFVIPAFLGFLGVTKTLMILGLAFTFTINNMASLSAEFHWFERGNLGIQLTVLSATFLTGWVLYNLVGRKFVYSIVAILFVVNSAIQLAPEDGGKTAPTSTDNQLVELVGSRNPLSTPNIYLMIYDAYVINETMLAYGIDNSAQEEYLESLGFEIYPHTYSVGADSTSTISRLFNASTEFYGKEKRAASGDGVVQNLLQSFGYQTYGIFPSDYFFQGVGSDYDVSFPEPSSIGGASSSVIKATFMGEFRSEVSYDVVSQDQFTEKKADVLESVTRKPRLVYTHDYYPGHSQNSGACLPNETALFAERLAQANYEMKQDMGMITEMDPGSIIIVAGDHGPYLTKNCYMTGDAYDVSEITRLDIQDRFGTFLAIRWPTEDFKHYDDITVLQDVFPAIFAGLFQDGTFLQAKVPSKTSTYEISGVWVEDGIIHGGINDGEPLFVGQG